MVEISPHASDHTAKPEYTIAFKATMSLSVHEQGSILTRYRPVLLTVIPFSTNKHDFISAKFPKEIRALTAAQLTTIWPPNTGIRNRPA